MTRTARSIALLVAVGLAPVACSRAEAPAASEAVAERAPTAVGQGPAAAASASPVAGKAGESTRKIIRQAELELEVASPGTTQTAIEHLAERRGGYVVSASRDTDTGSVLSTDVRVNLVVRVPQAELMSTIGELKRMGRGVGSEKITSDDVTDEYVDLNARIVSQKQLEQQYFEILKRAITVKDAMEVQKELAEVRTEIERMQGRQQLLDKESAFSTLTVHLTTAVPRLAVASLTFGDTLRRAWGDSVSLSADIVSSGIRALAFLIPVSLILILPGFLAVYLMVRLARVYSRRQRRLALESA